MLELQELCPSLDPRKIVTTTSGPHAFISTGDVIYYKGESLREWARPGFTVNRIEINKSASLVALSGDKTVAVYSFEGKLKHKDSMPTEVLKIVWHPLGVDDACLVALSIGLVRSIWLNSVGYPVVNALDFARNAIGAQDGPQFVNSMTFGASSSATGGFTLYLSTCEGSIFAVCPFLPPKFQFTSTQYNELLDFAASAYSQHQGNQDGEHIYAQQLEWVKSIEEQISDSQQIKSNISTIKPGEHVYILNAVDPAPLHCQGPLKVCPYPEELYDSDFMDIGSFSFENLHFLVQSSTNFLVLLLLDEPTPAHWAFSQECKDSSTLTLLEMLKVDGEQTLRITENLIWGETSTGTTLYTPLLVNSLEEGLESGQVGEIPATKVTELPKSIIYASIVDATTCSVLDFSQTSEHHYILTSASPMIEAESKALMPQENGSESYHNDILSDLQSALEDMSLEPSGPVPGLPEDNVKALAKLDKIADAYTQEIAKLYKCVEMAFDAVDIQKIELNQQLGSASKLESKIADFDTEKQAGRIEEVLERQSQIRERFKVFQAKIKAHHASASQPVSQIERRWFRELNGQSNTVNQFEGRAKVVEGDFKNVIPSGSRAPSSSTPPLTTGLPLASRTANTTPNYRIPLHRLKRLTSEIENLKTKLHSAST